MMAFGLSEHTLQILHNFFATQADIDCVKIYGSRALGTYKKGSDIDFAVYTHVSKDLSAPLLSALDALPTPYLFDVTDYNHLNHESLKQHIDQEGAVFFTQKIL